MQEEEFRNLTSGLFKGERLCLSKAITLIETSNPALFSFRDRLLDHASKFDRTNTIRLAVTGVPGAGKSTFINSLGIQWVASGHKVAVLAVDPSSEVSGGSVLGDKTRMAELAREEHAFIRPSPTRLHLGGVASSTFETILLCESAGYDRILVETVGVGQSELEAGQLTDACLLLLVAGAGDELQAVKRGVMEAADFILINKADGENYERAKIASRELNQVSSLWATRPGGNRTQVHFASSTEKTGLDLLFNEMEQFFSVVKQNGFFHLNRNEQEKKWFRRVLWNSLEELLKGKENLDAFMNELQQKKEKGVGLFDLISELNSSIKLDIKKPDKA
jgi:LAO/AO transport system kinase